MMKKIFLLALLSLSFVGFSQSLEHKIPSDALMVASIDGKHLQDFLSIPELEQYNFIKKVFDQASNNDNNITSVKDLGFDVNADAYYFMQKDSISYHSFMIKIADKTAFENLLGEDTLNRVTKENGLNIFEETSGIIIWDDNMFFFYIC